MITAESFLFDVATATTEMERSGIEVLWLAGWGFLTMWRQPRLRWSAAESKLRFSFLCLNLSVHVATAILPWSVSGIEVLWLAGWGFLMMWRQPYFHAASAESKFSGSPAKSFLPTSPASFPLSDFHLNHRSALPFLYTTFFTPAAPLL